jgi:hypothetical protein
MTSSEVRTGLALSAGATAVFTLLAIVVDGQWSCCPEGDTALGIPPATVAVALLVAESATALLIWRSLMVLSIVSWIVAVGFAWFLASPYAFVHVALVLAGLLVTKLRTQFFSQGGTTRRSDSGRDSTTT